MPDDEVTAQLVGRNLVDLGRPLRREERVADVARDIVAVARRARCRVELRRRSARRPGAQRVAAARTSRSATTQLPSLIRLRKIRSDLRRLAAGDAARRSLVRAARMMRVVAVVSRFNVRFAIRRARTTQCRSCRRGCGRARKTRRDRSTRTCATSRNALACSIERGSGCRRAERAATAAMRVQRDASLLIRLALLAIAARERRPSPHRRRAGRFRCERERRGGPTRCTSSPAARRASSTRTRKPALRSASARQRLHTSIARSSLERTIGTRTASIGAIFGGMRRPRSSPCTMISAPIIRHEMPHDVVYAYLICLIGVGELDIVGFRKVLTEVVRRPRLQRFAVGHQRLDRKRLDRARESVRSRSSSRRRPARRRRSRQNLGRDRACAASLRALPARRVRRVSLLPEKLHRAQERTRRFFPPHDVRPLIDENRQVAIRFDPLRVHRADDHFRGRADRQDARSALRCRRA